MLPFVLLLMAGELAHNGFYGFALLAVASALGTMGPLWAFIAAFWFGRSLRK